MNLVTCCELCKYQEEGRCHLPSGSPLSTTASSGCSYCIPREPGTDYHSSDISSTASVTNRTI